MYMKETMNTITNNRENVAQVGISVAIIGLVVLGGLKILSGDQLTRAKEFMADKSRITEQCGEDMSRCFLRTETICDGQDTMFDFSDDVCETIPYLNPQYYPAH